MKPLQNAAEHSPPAIAALVAPQSLDLCRRLPLPPPVWRQWRRQNPHHIPIMGRGRVVIGTIEPPEHY